MMLPLSAGQLRPLRCLGIFAAALSLLAGCGPSGPVQNHLSGSISFNGAPVAGGMIYFEPAEGNSGHTGFARIAQGRYDTAADGGKGPVSGKLSVRIEPGVNLTTPIVDDNAPVPPRPFTVWHEVIELATGGGMHDFNVPENADQLMQAKPAPRGNDP